MQTDADILIVEDSPTQAAQLEEILRVHGYTTRTAPDGLKALEAVRLRRPALVVSDVMMPVMDGFEFCRAVKLDHELRDIPVILLTSLSSPADLLSALEAGADFHIPKPYQGDYLLGKVDEVLSRGSGDGRTKPESVESVIFGGTAYQISATREQMLRLLLSTYEVAIQQNQELLTARAELQTANETLEDKVRDRTANLLAEIAERKRAEAERDQIQAQLVQSQKLESIGTLAGGVAHEINNPIMGIMNYAQLILDRLGPDSPVAEFATEIGKESERVTAIVKDLLSFARQDKQTQGSPARMSDIVDSTLSLVRSGAGVRRPAAD